MIKSWSDNDQEQERIQVGRSAGENVRGSCIVLTHSLSPLRQVQMKIMNYVLRNLLSSRSMGGGGTFTLLW